MSEPPERRRYPLSASFALLVLVGVLRTLEAFTPALDQYAMAFATLWLFAGPACAIVYCELSDRENNFIERIVAFAFFGFVNLCVRLWVNIHFDYQTFGGAAPSISAEWGLLFSIAVAVLVYPFYEATVYYRRQTRKGLW